MSEGRHQHAEEAVRIPNAKIPFQFHEHFLPCVNEEWSLSQNPKVIKASVNASKKYGAGSGASRLITGNNPLYCKLEEMLSKFKEGNLQDDPQEMYEIYKKVIKQLEA